MKQNGSAVKRKKVYQVFIGGVSDGAVVDEDVVERLLVLPGQAVDAHLADPRLENKVRLV